MTGFVKHSETDRWVSEEEKNNPFALQYDTPPVTEVPMYDPFDEANKTEAAMQKAHFAKVDPHNSNRVETSLQAGMQAYIKETLPGEVKQADDATKFYSELDKEILNGYFEKALSMLNTKIEIEAPKIKDLEDKVASLLATVGIERALELIESIRISNISVASRPKSSREAEFASMVVAGQKEIPNEIKALVLTRANLRESIANEKAAAGMFKEYNGAVQYSSREASDSYFNSAVERMLVGPLPDARRQIENGYPEDYMTELQRKSLAKIRELLEKASNWNPALVRFSKQPASKIVPIEQKDFDTGDRGITNILLKRRKD